MSLKSQQTGLNLKTWLGLYLALILTQENFKNFFKKIKCTTMPVHHIKGQPAASTCVREKGGITSDTIHETPCRY